VRRTMLGWALLLGGWTAWGAAPSAAGPGPEANVLQPEVDPQAAGGGHATASTVQAQAAAKNGDLLTMFPHPETTPWYLAGQANIIFQAHPGFHSPYQGPNSLHGAGEYKTSLLGTLFLGYQLQRGLQRGLHGEQSERSKRYNTEFLLDLESSGGRGLSEALGLAGFTNLDVVRNPNLGSKPYVAHAELHQTIGFTHEMTEVDRGPLNLATEAPVRRLELRLGKLALPDQFDVNDVLSGSHQQFTNWTIDNSGAWDYAADTRGYTYAGIAEYQDRRWAARYALALFPTVANGITLDWAIRRARGQNWEFELRRGLLPGRKGTQRVLAFVNNAHLGDYRQSVALFEAGIGTRPDITRTERFGAVKYGFGYNLDQQLTEHLRVGARFGWNEGQHESFAYTEVDQTVLAGVDYNGAQWARPADKFGIAVVTNAIKRDHQNYLAAGGLGFLLGDGRLRYGRENTEEAYYNAHAWRGMFFALGLSHIDNPGYNRDRGPVWVPSVRTHLEF
jgi:high affinity Mn2+ porin